MSRTTPTGGRPLKYTPAQIAQALAQARGLRAYAARLLGCSRNTITAYLNRYPAVAQADQEATDELLDAAEAQLIADVLAGDRAQVRYYLETKGRRRGYGRAPALAVELPSPEALDALSDDDLDRLITRLARRAPPAG